MPLSRAQLLSGNTSQGTVLNGQVQGVRAGTGLSLDNDGTLNVIAAPNLWTQVGAALQPTTTNDRVLVFSGNQSLPGLAIVNDPNTGMYSPGSNQIGFATDGTGRLFIDGTGVVRIANLAGNGTQMVVADNSGNISKQAVPSGVTSVTGASPIFSSGGSAPEISISAATTSAAGSMSSTDKGKLDNLPGSLFDGTVPLPVGSASAGSGNIAARVNHVHAHGDQGGGSLHSIAVPNGAAGFMSGADKAELDALPGSLFDNSTPQQIGIASPGSGTIASRANHVHAHGDLAGGSLHAIVVAGGAAGFMSGADKTKLDSLGGSTVTSVSGTSPIVSSGGSTPAISINAATGSSAGSMSASDKDKLDNLPGSLFDGTTPQPLGSASAGSGNIASRVNHVHAHGDQGGGSLHSVAVPNGAAGFMSGSDKAKLDGLSGGGVTNVSGTAPIVSSGGTTPAISINAATSSSAGSMSSADKSKLDNWNTSASGSSSTNPISVANGSTAPILSFSIGNLSNLP